MAKFIIYFILLVLSIVSYLLMKKYDTSKRRKVFVVVWAIFVIASMIYPLFLPGRWNLGFLFSGYLTCFFLSFDAEDEENLETSLGS
jgi:hypothetical protein